MGILNVTPDSFFDGGKHQASQDRQAQVERIRDEGADIIDIGGYSSRPGAKEVSVKEELERVLSGIATVQEVWPEALISVDTFRSEVAEQAVMAGAQLINDISGGQLDERMFEVVAKYQVPYIMMHMRGRPETMQSLTDYNNLTLEMVTYFQERIKMLKDLGVNDIILDPGFGFAKDLDQNYELLQQLDHFQLLELPLLVGLSRKSMIYKPLGITAEEALNGTTALHAIALMKGAKVLRVHDVKAAKECVELFNKMQGA
ncbi:dihydropteroate synthase [Persicobacter psychrovividus]|uniref:dihydropteroate synthase n=1 Tax=Persicobacter psychrovividus TaxID=387638 RepID=A0ABM7VGV3_9BACT|nr:dihydropteroate synthase [Persicobacter psychrovividus]